jgi:RNA polymerase sigma factor (sigma-70 family)
MTDRELLDNFVETRSHDAFAALVQRHIGLVYNAARRQLPRDPAMIDDVCQAVFIVLARRAASLPDGVVLPGWLIRTAHLTARDALKLARRRRLHEQRYAAMSALNQTTSTEPADDAFAHELSPHVDRALAHLSDGDRAAIVLRYLQGQPMDQLAATFNVSIETATKRVQRATARLRNYFARHPITPSVAALTAAMQQMPRAAPPPALVQSASAMATTATATATATAGGATTSSLLARGTIKMIFWSNAKAAATAAAAAILAISATVGTVSLVRAQATGDGGGGTVIFPPPPSPAAAPAPKPAPTTEPAQAVGSLVANLSNGVSVELIGLTEYPGDNNPWWQGDGSPLPKPPQLPNNMMGSMAGPDLMRRVAVHINTRVTGTLEPATVQWALGDRGGMDFNFPMMPGRRNPAAQFRIFQVKDTHPTTLRANVATAAWTTIVASDVQGKRETIGPDTYVVGKAIESTGRGTRNGTQFDFTQPDTSSDARRVIVIDTSGAAHDVIPQQMSDNGKTQNFTYVVPAVPLAKVKEIQVQTRPFDQWVEFRNVCIDPKQHTDLTIATSDDAQGL